MLTIKQVAEQLQISPSLVYSLCASSRLEHVRIGVGRGVIRVTEESLKRFVEESRKTTSQSPLWQLKHIRLEPTTGNREETA